jgi:hypothetical protein
MASMSVDLPLPFSPTKNMTCGWKGHPRTPCRCECGYTRWMYKDATTDYATLYDGDPPGPALDVPYRGYHRG